MTRTLVGTALLLCLSSRFSSAGDDGLQALRAVMSAPAVKIEQKSSLTAGTDKVPPVKAESWRFVTGATEPVVRYGRYLNQPPDFKGVYPSLPTGDIGLGLDGGSFGNWYRGGCLRVKVNNRDLMAEKPATRIESQAGANGYLRLIWEFEEQRRLTLNFLVPDDGHTVDTRIDLTLPGLAVTTISVELICYPGGYGPAYHLPSHRFVITPTATAEVPKGFTVSPTNPFPTVPLGPADGWVFYGDKREAKGGLGLLVSPAATGGKIQTSNYGIQTVLNYPPTIRQIYLAFSAYDQENEPAQKTFQEKMANDRTFLMQTPYWPETK